MLVACVIELLDDIKLLGAEQRIEDVHRFLLRIEKLVRRMQCPVPEMVDILTRGERIFIIRYRGVHPLLQLRGDRVKDVPKMCFDDIYIRNADQLLQKRLDNLSIEVRRATSRLLRRPNPTRKMPDDRKTRLLIFKSVPVARFKVSSRLPRFFALPENIIGE